MAPRELGDVHTFYGNIEALKGVSITVEEGEIVTLIGANGAGKSRRARDLGLTPPRRARFASKARSMETAPQDTGSASRSRPRGARSPAHDGEREPRPRGVPARDSEIARTATGVGSSPFPRPEGTRERRRPHDAGGEQQKLALARLMAPKLCCERRRLWESLHPVERIYERSPRSIGRERRS